MAFYRGDFRSFSLQIQKKKKNQRLNLFWRNNEGDCIENEAGW